MRRLIILTTLLASAAGVEAATLNKCIDARGDVTYSNLPCRNAQEARTVEIDPVPPPDRTSLRPVKPAASGTKETATLHLDTQRTPGGMNVSGKPVSSASARQCATLSDKLGRVFDKMDQARRKGYTQVQMDAWEQEVKELERKKQRSGCF